MAGRRGIDEDLGADGRTAAVEDLGLHGIAAAVSRRSADPLAPVLPGDDKAAIRQGGDLGISLMAGSRGVDQALGADGRTAVVEDLRLDGETAAVTRCATDALAQVLPGDDKTAVRQGGDPGTVLMAGRRGVDEDLGADGRATVVEDLRLDGCAAGVSRRAADPLAVVFPGDNKAAIRQGRDLGTILKAGRCGVDEDLGADGAPLSSKSWALTAVMSLHHLPSRRRSPGCSHSR